MSKALKSREKTAAWNALSRYIRLKRCMETTGCAYVGVCVTCGKKFHRDFLDCGHAIAGKSNSLLLNRHLLDIQCRMCNRTWNGRLKDFRAVMEARHGVEWVDRWWSKLKRITIRDDRIDWAGRRARYERQLKALIVKHGVLWQDGRD